MTLHETAPDQILNVARFATEMEAAGLPSAFVAGTMKLAIEDQGIYELMELWHEAAEDMAQRDQIVADLQEALEEVEESPSVPEEKPRIDFDQLDDVARAVMAHKRKLRDLVDRHGGVSAVARKMNVPQPSLSRMLNSAAMPRRTTLYRLARALDVPESEIVTEWYR